VGISPKPIEDTIITSTSEPSSIFVLCLCEDEEIVLMTSDLNALVLDYLLVEGFSDAAISFAKETGLSVDIDTQAIRQRMIIKEAVEDGRVEDAVRSVNELDPEVCYRFFSLYTPMFAPMIQTSCTTLSRLAACHADTTDPQTCYEGQTSSSLSCEFDTEYSAD